MKPEGQTVVMTSAGIWCQSDLSLFLSGGPRNNNAGNFTAVSSKVKKKKQLLFNDESTTDCCPVAWDQSKHSVGSVVTR